MKRLKSIVEYVGGNLSYSFKDNIHEYCIQVGLVEKKYRSSIECNCIVNAEDFIKKTYPILYSNALNSIK